MVPAAAMSYSVWLKPPQPLHAAVARLIDTHAAQLGTPAFVPHVTLLGGIACDTEVRGSCTAVSLHVHLTLPRQATALRLTQQLAAQLKPLARPTCRAARAEAGSIYYQCVYIRQHDDLALTAWHETARAVFETPAAAGSCFMPHMSVVYGNLTAEEKERHVEAVEAALKDVDTTFTPGTLALWRTPAGLTDTWTEIAQFDV